MLKKFLGDMYIRAGQHNDRNVLEAIKDFGPHKNFLDVGCWDGEKTLEMSKLAGAKNIFGIEPIATGADKAEKLGINTLRVFADKDTWPIEDNSCDCIVSNQVVEHLSNLDHYFSESARSLKSGGYLITSTNNLASWHNIISLILGFAPFDLTNSSSKVKGIGNPFAVHRGETDPRGSSWTHKCIYTAKWLSDWQDIYGLKTLKVYGAGYYPLPTELGNIMKKHCAFITIVAQKA